jgi:hypothetical protein
MIYLKDQGPALGGVASKDADFRNRGCVKSTLMSVSDCQSIIKMDIVERLKKVYKLGSS